MSPSNLPRPAVGVSALVFDANERVLLIKRGRPPSSGYWHAPGGKLEPGEGMVEACRREVREETSLNITVGPVMAVVERRLEGFHYIIIDFLARLDAGGDCELRASDDATEAAWVAESDLSNYLIADGLLPIIERARLAHRGAVLGLYGNGRFSNTDFMPVLAPTK